MSYYQENRPTMGGLADALAMQGRRGDSTLVHMNPMEVRMLETMSPDGRLSINPETGLPEAFKLKDILGLALPIAGGALLGPAIAPGLIGTAIGTGLGGVGAGLIQGKGVGDSLIQGGLSGLMSYGLGSLSSAFAPSGGVTAGPPSGPDVFGEATASPFGIGAAQEAGTLTTVGGPESTGFFGGLGETLKQTPFTDVPSVGSPTYGSMLGSGASGLLSSSLLAPEEMPYDIAGMDDMDAYYAGRIPDLEAGRRRGRAAARQLQSPPSFLTSGGLYERAISPGGGGTFFAADGGQVPNPYGDPYGPGDPYGGMADETDFGQPSSTGPGMSLGSFNEPVADLGLGKFNPSPLSIGLGLVGLAMGVPALGLASSMMGTPNVNALGQTQVSGVGNTTVDSFGNVVGTTQADIASMSAAPATSGVTPGLQDPMGVFGDFTSTGQGLANQQAVADFAAAHGEEVGAASEAPGAEMGGQEFAQGGGISSLAYGGEAAPVGFANKAFEGMVPGTGTGMSDDVPFSIEGNQPALLSRDEYVLPADVVSQLGDGSSGAGADMLDSFVSNVRQTKYGNTQQPAPVGPQLMTGLMRQGGTV
jgi:hypothetical protein